MASGLKAIEALLYRAIAAGGERGEADDAVAGIVAGDDRLDAAARVAIYANMYFSRLLRVLEEDFPATRAVLGEERFQAAVKGYLRAHPPSHFSVARCGARFADYLRHDPSSAQFPYAPDLARLERALIDSFHAADARALDADAIRAVAPADWPALRMRTHPATYLLDLEWRVAELRRAAGESGILPTPIRGGCTIVVWRNRSQAYYREIDRSERAGLALAARGAAFSEICEAVAEASECGDPAAQVARLLQSWLGDGLLIGE